jgi:hypothetical protein
MSLITLHLYLVYWLFQTFREVRAYRGRGRGGILGTLLSIVVVGFFVLPHYVGRMYSESRQPRPISAWKGLLVFVPVIGVYLWIASVQQNLNKFGAREELEAGRQQREEYGERECLACGAFSSSEATHCRKCRQLLPQGS